MRWSPDPRPVSAVVRGQAADGARPARFNIPLGQRVSLPPEVAERLAAQARAAGYAIGWAEGRRAADEETQRLREELSTQAREALDAQAVASANALRAVAAAASRLEERTARIAADLEAQLVEAAFALAEALVGHELAASTDPGRDALRRALALAPQGRPALVRLHPDDAATMSGSSTVDGRDVVVVADASLSRGDAIVDCDSTNIDARIDAALRRAREALS